MSQRECDKCDEMVDETKAFCPGCGHAFDNEKKRHDSSEFDMMDGTMQFSKTAYGLMLSDMGLNISAPSDKPDPEVVQPTVSVYQPVAQPAVQHVTRPSVQMETPKQGSSNKWLIIGGIVIVIFIMLIAAIVIGLFLRSRFG